MYETFLQAPPDQVLETVKSYLGGDNRDLAPDDRQLLVNFVVSILAHMTFNHGANSRVLILDAQHVDMRAVLRELATNQRLRMMTWLHLRVLAEMILTEQPLRAPGGIR